MIVIVGKDLAPQLLTAGCPGQPPLDDGIVLCSRWWARGKLRVWQRAALVNLRHDGNGIPAVCAGGPIGYLDLAGMRAAAGFHAGLRWHQWSQAVDGTRAAQPWHVIEAQHRADPGKLPFAQARRRFLDQPRINAMHLSNAANPAAPQLDFAEIEMFQAGYQAYQHYHALTALCGDALMPADGERLQPAGDALADRISYLADAARLLESLPRKQCVVAVTLPDLAAVS